jgi:hypothetical protein
MQVKARKPISDTESIRLAAEKLVTVYLDHSAQPSPLACPARLQQRSRLHPGSHSHLQRAAAAALLRRAGRGSCPRAVNRFAGLKIFFAPRNKCASSRILLTNSKQQAPRRLLKNNPEEDIKMKKIVKPAPWCAAPPWPVIGGGSLDRPHPGHQERQPDRHRAAPRSVARPPLRRPPSPPPQSTGRPGRRAGSQSPGPWRPAGLNRPTRSAGK